MNLLFSIMLPLGLLSLQQKSLHEILDPFTAKWQGTFKVYSYDGRLVDQLEVEQRYWWEGDEQHAVFIERYRDGKTVRARARNYEKNGQFFCEVEKDTGERTVHLGRFEDGLLFWYRQTPDGNVTESFKERVAKTAAGREYQIDGLGVYKNAGSTSVLFFEGRYREVK
jgi:hypothetical protein